MAEEDKWDVEEEVDQEYHDEKEVRESVLTDASVRRLDVKKLLNTPFINDHLGDVLVLVLSSYIERKSIVEIFYVPVTTLHQQFFNDSTIATHHC